MPLIWSIASRERTVRIVADGEVLRSEFDAMTDDLIDREALGYAKLFNGLRATTRMSPDEIMAVGVRFRGLQDTHALGPLAVAVPPEKFHVVARVLGILATAKRPMRVFDNVTSAQRWLKGLRGTATSPAANAARGEV